MFRKLGVTSRVQLARVVLGKAVFAYLIYYNNDRLHSTLKSRTPYEARVCYRQPIALAA